MSRTYWRRCEDSTWSIFAAYLPHPRSTFYTVHNLVAVITMLPLLATVPRCLLLLQYTVVHLQGTTVRPCGEDRVRGRRHSPVSACRPLQGPNSDTCTPTRQTFACSSSRLSKQVAETSNVWPKRRLHEEAPARCDHTLWRVEPRPNCAAPHSNFEYEADWSWREPIRLPAALYLLNTKCTFVSK